MKTKLSIAGALAAGLLAAPLAQAAAGCNSRSADGIWEIQIDGMSDYQSGYISPLIGFTNYPLYGESVVQNSGHLGFNWDNIGNGTTTDGSFRLSLSGLLVIGANCRLVPTTLRITDPVVTTDAELISGSLSPDAKTLVMNIRSPVVGLAFTLHGFKR
jgi:hypothetical protein